MTVECKKKSKVQVFDTPQVVGCFKVESDAVYADVGHILTSWGHVWWYIHLLKAYTHILMGIICQINTSFICTFLFTTTALKAFYN